MIYSKTFQTMVLLNEFFIKNDGYGANLQMIYVPLELSADG